MERSWMLLVVLQLSSCVLADPAQDSYSLEANAGNDLSPPSALVDSTDLQPPASSAHAASDFPADMDVNTRRRRGLEPLGPLNRRKRTYHYNPCNTCGGGGGGYKPHRVEVVIVPQRGGGGCGGNCGGGYKPQPRPQPQPYCDSCNRPSGGGGGGGSFSQSSASAQSSSFSWGGKK